MGNNPAVSLEETIERIVGGEWDEEIVPCPVCDGEGVPLGALGNRMHYRCRACGMDFNHEGKDGY